MRRVAPALILTVIGLVALATFKSTAPATGAHPSGLKAAASRGPTSTAPAATAPPPAGTGTGPGRATPAPTAATAAQTYDGDPFEHTSHVTHTLMDGRIVYDRAEYLKMPFERRVLGAADGIGSVGCCLEAQ